MSAKPFSTYPEDRERLLCLARIIQTPGLGADEYECAADELSDLVIEILEDEAIALALTEQEV